MTYEVSTGGRAPISQVARSWVRYVCPVAFVLDRARGLEATAFVRRLAGRHPQPDVRTDCKASPQAAGRFVGPAPYTTTRSGYEFAVGP
jgi:hypothetical protein